MRRLATLLLLASCARPAPSPAPVSGSSPAPAPVSVSVSATSREAALAEVEAARAAIRADLTVRDPDAPAPTAPSALELRLLDALHVYLRFLPEGDDERIASVFLIARTAHRYGDTDLALPLYEEIIRTRPDHEVAEYAANLLLDGLVTLGRHHDLLAWLQAMLGDHRLLAGRDELADRLRLLEQQALRYLDEHR